MKTVSFSIRPVSDVMDAFAKTFEAVRSGRQIPKGPRQEVGFTSIEAARNFLTRERLALLRAIRTHHPDSLYELAKIVDRNFKNVQEDIRLLERHGLVRIAKEPRGKRTVKVPRVPFQEIALKIAIWGSYERTSTNIGPQAAERSKALHKAMRLCRERRPRPAEAGLHFENLETSSVGPNAIKRVIRAGTSRRTKDWTIDAVLNLLQIWSYEITHFS